MGSTYTGEFEDVKGLDAAVEKVNKEKGFNVGIHVDAASGGFIAPFTVPELEWDFRLKNVHSINVSGHKCAPLLCCLDLEPFQKTRCNWSPDLSQDKKTNLQLNLLLDEEDRNWGSCK